MTDAATTAKVEAASWLADYFGDEIAKEAVRSLAARLDAYATEQTAALRALMERAKGYAVHHIDCPNDPDCWGCELLALLADAGRAGDAMTS